ncbi:unnamed protein product [Ilex paraguariensis]|uniref:Transcription factor MYC/MYB N-terminal domain-containing protein n=1 Tax=Ilex paraguariensis TaxID=185542 RepID=A0ABC8UWD2_9AQUA
MGTTPLRQFLQSVCCNSPWNYAVFWKLQLQNQMVLTWEDGYCNIQRLRDSMESILDDLCLKGSDELSSNFECSTLDGNNPTGLAVAEMSSVHYALGDGIVGEVAYTGNHRWILSDNISGGALFPKCPDEWLLQFVAGIKTILLVSVVPDGVLQLGSFNMVAEDLALVTCLVNKFKDIQTVRYSAPFTSKRKFPVQTSLLPMSTLTENFDESSAMRMNGIKSGDSNSVDGIKSTMRLLTTDQLMPSCMIQDSCNMFEKYLPNILEGATENDSNVQSTSLIEVEELLNQSLYDENEEMTDVNMFKFSFLEEELQDISCTNMYNSGSLGTIPMK